jgi:hypothetical protein
MGYNPWQQARALPDHYKNQSQKTFKKTRTEGCLISKKCKNPKLEVGYWPGGS